VGKYQAVAESPGSELDSTPVALVPTVPPAAALAPAASESPIVGSLKPAAVPTAPPAVAAPVVLGSDSADVSVRLAVVAGKFRVSLESLHEIASGNTSEESPDCSSDEVGDVNEQVCIFFI
jgi:hypothetical protein